jgi:opacity protein-like surface antigen
VKKQVLLGITCAWLAAGVAAPSSAQNGFYGGLSMRDHRTEANGLILGEQTLVWSRFSAPVAEDADQRSLVFGGYRWKNNVAVEAAFNSATTDKYALRSSATGLSLGPGVGLNLGDISVRTWNADVYTSWEMIRTLSLYGRLGYAQNDLRPFFAGASLVQGDTRRLRDGVNYGLGLRYDVTHSLGLRVEYARFGRFAGETVTGIPDSDQVSIGVQYRF